MHSRDPRIVERTINKTAGPVAPMSFEARHGAFGRRWSGFLAQRDGGPKALSKIAPDVDEGLNRSASPGIYERAGMAALKGGALGRAAGTGLPPAPHETFAFAAPKIKGLRSNRQARAAERAQKALRSIDWGLVYGQRPANMVLRDSRSAAYAEMFGAHARAATRRLNTSRMGSSNLDDSRRDYKLAEGQTARHFGVSRFDSAGIGALKGPGMGQGSAASTRQYVGNPKGVYRDELHIDPKLGNQEINKRITAWGKTSVSGQDLRARNIKRFGYRA